MVFYFIFTLVFTFYLRWIHGLDHVSAPVFALPSLDPGCDLPGVTVCRGMSFRAPAMSSDID